MKKHLLFVSVSLLLSGYSAFGQNSPRTVPGSVAKSTVLSGISAKIAEREASFNSGSRANALTASEELKNLYTSYSEALTKELMKTSSEAEKKELSNELRYSEKRKAELSTKH